MQLMIEHEEAMCFAAGSGEHRITIDLPEPQGGSGRGLAPPQLFMASLGTCIGVYVVDYCESVGVPSRGLKIHMRWEQMSRPKRIGRIHAEVLMPDADIEPQRLAAIRRVAEQCLLINTLRQAPAFDVDVTAVAGSRPELSVA